MEYFELGPIRPPSEAQSILLRLTRNCHWNKCAFCPVYKEKKFSMRKVDEIKSDIDSMYEISEKIFNRIGSSGLIDSDSGSIARAVREIVEEEDLQEGYVRQVAFWIANGMRSLFLQDADSLVMKTENLVEILNYVRKKFPSIERITSYARAKTISRKTLENLKDLRTAGLNRIHIGMETGSDKVLEMVNKGVTQAEQIIAGQNCIEAGFELSEYYMPGLGGKELWKENAEESAKVVNAVNPMFIRIRSTIPVPGTPLFEMMSENKWSPLSEEGKVKEIELFIKKLKDVTSTIQSDHIMNLLEDIEGTLPEDRGNILATVNNFFEMDENDRETFILGRRIGRFRHLRDFRPMPELETLKSEIKSRYSSLEEGMLQFLRNYI